MKIFLGKSDLQKSLENSEKQLLSVDRAVKSLEDLSSDSRKSDEFDYRLGFLLLMAKRFSKLVAETQIMITFYLRPDRVRRLIGEERTADLFAELTASFDRLWPISKNLEDTLATARTIKSVGERIECVDTLRVSVSGLKETFAGLALEVREIMELSADRPHLRLLKGFINASIVAVATTVVLMLASRSLVNLPQWFQMLIIAVVAIGIFVSCLRGKPPVVALIDLA